MRTSGLRLIGALSLSLLIAPAHSEETSFEFAFMPRTMSVVLLNEGGKYVAIDLKHIPQGGSCRMDKDAIILRVGPTAKGKTLVRYIAPQISSGGCPFLTMFELSEVDYSSARSAFLAKEADARKRIEDLKKQLGEKWDELTGKKPEKSGAAPDITTKKMHALLSSSSMLTASILAAGKQAWAR
jgi:hypothetical protein